MNKAMVIRVIGECALIVVSILLALSADAWLDSRNRTAELDGQLSALARDFETMLQRVNASHDAASRGAEAGRQIATLVQEGADIDQESARQLLWHLTFYEVFSPSTGAYQALIASGNLELLDNDRLKIDMVDFFGSFEDVRASEKLLLETQTAFFASASYSRLAGWHRMGQGRLPVLGRIPVEDWARSDEFLNGVGIYTVRQSDVLDDYEYLKARIHNVAAAIEAQRSK